jgi:pyruvyl transferase EpsI
MISTLKKFLPSKMKQIVRDLVSREDVDLPEGPRAFVFLAADYGNIGDLAISQAQRLFLARNLPGYSVVPVPISRTRAMLRSIRKQIASCDLVTVIGGGNMGSLYPDIEELRQLVIGSFPNNRIVCFPQTLDSDESRESQHAIDRIARVYSRHPNLHVHAREAVSHGKLKELFANRPTVEVGFVPDIVLSATAADLGARGIDAPRGALLCLRDDRERSLDDAHRETLRRVLASAGLDTEMTDTHAGGSRLAPERCSELLADKITQFQGAQLVVTDRLHGMILAALAGTPCLVLPNSNHKIRQTWMDWLHDVAQVRFLGLDELSGIEGAVHDLLATPRRDPATPIIDPWHYDALRMTIDHP